MKQKADPRRLPTRNRDILTHLSHQQFAGIGMVALCWNDLDHLLNWVLDACLGFDVPMNLEITSRIHGFDGRLAIIKSFTKNYYDVPQEIANLFNNTMSLVGECKSLRDAIVHTRVFNAKDAIGETIEKRGQKTHVLISAEALMAVALRTVHAWDELSIVYKYLSASTGNDQMGPRHDPEEGMQSHELELLEYVSQLRLRQKKRRSLPRLPKFPPLPPVQED